ncbi:diguanylate cyclase domain-containing protein [Thalassospira sp.]|uniref:sensor domain-containing protein n=1 Tax=Thalassospira sp. TaxID=1912094 RepID=UPI00311F9130
MPGPFLKDRYFIGLHISWWLLGLWLCGGIEYALALTDSDATFPPLSTSLVFFLSVAGLLAIVHFMVRRNAKSRPRFCARLPGLVFRIDEFGKIEFASEQGLDWAGASITDSLRNQIFDHDALMNLRQAAIEAKGEIQTTEMSVKTNHGEQRWVRIQMRALPPITPDCQIDCIIWDITELVEERNRRQESEERLKILETLSNEAIFLHDGGKCIDTNNAAERMFGYDRSELLLLSAADIISSETLPLVMANIRSGYDKPYEAIAVCKDGSKFPCEINGRNVVVQGQTLRLTSFTNISDRKFTEEQIRFQANHDALTSLPNRYLFMDRLNFAIKLSKRRRECFALMFIDIDEFKSLNDTGGHSTGDKALDEIAKRLTGTLRNVDTVARIGGDEFTIILPGTETPEDAELVARKLQTALSGSAIEFGDDLSPYTVTASIGIALYPDHGETVDELIAAADDAMYAAKKSGRNTFRFATNNRSRTE